MLDKNAVDLLKASVRIEDIIGQYVTLNDSNKGSCPFHEEDEPSFSVNIEEQYFNCFGCGVGGDVITFLMRIKRISFGEAIKEIANGGGTPPSAYHHSEILSLEDERKKQDILNDASSYFRTKLIGEPLEYLLSRGITESSIQRFQLGFDDGQVGIYLVTEKGHDPSLVAETGLVLQANLTDALRGRIVFPYLSRGTVVRFVGRSLNGVGPKFMKLKGQKDEFFYNEDALHGRRSIIVTEGPFDVIQAYQHGITDIVAIVGTGLNSYLFGKLAVVDSVYLCLDGDEAGKKATIKLAERLGEKSRIIELPNGQDLDDYFRAGNTAEDFSRLKSNARAPDLRTPVTQTVVTESIPERDTLTDDANAERFVAQMGDRFRYSYHRRSWYVYRNGVWVADIMGNAQKAGQEIAKSIYREASEAGDPDRRKAIAKWAEKCENGLRQNLMLEKAQPLLAVDINDFDSDPMLFNCANGTINLRTGELRPHKPENLMTIQSPVKYDPGATSPRWERFLQTVFMGDESLIGYLQKVMGYFLTGLTSDQSFFYNHGIGANGKSTMTDVIHHVMGGYSQKARIETFLHKTSNESSHEIAILKPCRFVWASEPSEGRRWNEGLLKELTSSEPLSARFLYGHLFTFTPQFKVWFLGNHKPSVRDDSEGFWRRMRLIPFLYRIPETERIGDYHEYLLEEAEGILGWMVQGCLEFQSEGLNPPAKVVEAVREYREEEDVVSQFLDEMCIRSEAMEESVTDTSIAFNYWAVQVGEKEISRRKLSDKLKSLGFESVRRVSGYVWQGIGLRKDENLMKIIADFRKKRSGDTE